MTTEQAITQLELRGFTPKQITDVLTTMPDLGEGTVDLGDSGCDEDCAGWNGIDARCECGNRRVYWTFEDGSAYWEMD
jgi:hypothetical protein